MNEKFYEFINSRDIREYLREKEYPVDSLQCAYLVWQSKRNTLKEKHAAWQEIIDTMPDMPVPESSWCAGWNSLHGMLRDYMAMEDKFLKRFQEKEERAFYTYAWQEDGFDWSREEFFTQDFAVCFEAALADCGEYGDRFRITKRYFESGRNSHITADFSKDGSTLCIDISFCPRRDETAPDEPCCTEEEEDLLVESFEGMWFDIPIPFRKGDIVCGCFGGEPFVLEDTVPWSRRERGSKRTDGDYTGMLSCGVRFNADEGYLTDHEGPFYLDLEYYRGELNSGQRVLEAYSRHLRGELDTYRLMQFQRLACAESEVEGLSWLVRELEYLRKFPGKQEKET